MLVVDQKLFHIPLFKEIVIKSQFS